MNHENAVHEMHKAFNLLNNHFFEGKLPEPYIVVLSTIQKKAYGWFTPSKIWTDASGEVQKHEIAMSAEYMNRDYIEVIGTLLHEMIHLYCHVNEIRDTSRKGRYHNANFKRESEAHGFFYDHDTPDRRHGWTFSKLTDETKDFIRGFSLDESAFALARKIVASTSRKKPVYKYVCSSCEAKARSSKPLNLICGDCDEPMEMSVR